MAIFVAIVVSVIVFIVIDHICYWRRIDNFEKLADEFSEMYNRLYPLYLPDYPDPETTELIFDGENFYVLVLKDDIKSFYKQMQIAISTVIDSYDKIGERYLNLMDDETAKRISSLHYTVEQINHIIRYQCWRKGVK